MEFYVTQFWLYSENTFHHFIPVWTETKVEVVWYGLDFFLYQNLSKYRLSKFSNRFGRSCDSFRYELQYAKYIHVNIIERINE